MIDSTSPIKEYSELRVYTAPDYQIVEMQEIRYNEGFLERLYLEVTRDGNIIKVKPLWKKIGTIVKSR
jgi:hypothetical protein